MPKRGNRRVRKAKGALDKMMKLLRPYLPRPRGQKAPPPQEWKLPKDSYKTGGVIEGRKSVSL